MKRTRILAERRCRPLPSPHFPPRAERGEPWQKLPARGQCRIQRLRLMPPSPVVRQSQVLVVAETVRKYMRCWRAKAHAPVVYTSDLTCSGLSATHAESKRRSHPKARAAGPPKTSSFLPSFSCCIEYPLPKRSCQGNIE